MKYYEIPQISSINRKVSPFLNEVGELREGQNIDISKIGIAEKTGDYSLVDTQITASQDILGFGMYTRDDGTYEFYTVCDGDSNSDIYKLSGGSWSAQSQSLTSGAQGYFASMPELDLLFFANYSDDTRGYNGSSWSTSTNLTDAPKAHYLNASHDFRLFLGNCNVGGTSYPCRYYYSSQGDSGTLSWDTTNDWNALPEPITGFANHGRDQLVFTEHFIFRADAYERKMIAQVGAINQDVIQTMNEWTLFANRNGVYATNQAQTQKISQAVSDYIDGVSSPSDMRAAASDDFYYLYLGSVTLGSDTLTNVVLEYDVSQNKWSRLGLGEEVKSMGMYITSGQEEVYFGNDDGEVFKLFDGDSQNGSDFPAFIELAPVLIDDNPKFFQKIVAMGNNLNGIKVQYKLREDDRWSSAGELRGSLSEVKFGAKGAYLYLRLSEMGQGEPFKLYRLLVGYDDAENNL